MDTPAENYYRRKRLMTDKLQIKFIKLHPNAKLPEQSHGNRPVVKYEQDWLNDIVTKQKLLDPRVADMIKNGAVFDFPKDKDGNMLGTSDSGYDIFACEGTIIPKKGKQVVATGIQVGYISPGYWFRIESRSGLSFKHGVLAHPGVIDNGYRGTLEVTLYNHSDDDKVISVGDRIAQLVVYPVIAADIGWIDSIIETPRNEKGIGSSGK